MNKKSNLLICFGWFTLILPFNQHNTHPKIYLTLIPPTTITDKVDLDIRAGIKNLERDQLPVEITFYLNEEKKEQVIFQTKTVIAPRSSFTAKFNLQTAKHVGDNKIIVVTKGKDFEEKRSKNITIISSGVRSTKTIGGAWISFYHWSETEGKMWNPAIKNLTDDQWKEMISSMHNIGMNIVVIQESFRNQDYVGKHDNRNVYEGRAYYPSNLFPGRMPIAAKDPIEAVLSRADSLGMFVFMGVGMYAWFDYTPGSLEWHKKVAKELWDKYGQHPSFYGFYVSEEGMGSLDCFEKDSSKQDMRRREVLDFFAEFTPFCNQMAPGKPVMFAPNGWGVGRSKGTYPKLLKNVDIICPFAFSRMPEGDLTGSEAISLLQKYCNDSKSHLWLDLEAFLINQKEGYLYPRPIGEIESDLKQYDNFEKVICYQYPGVFNNPKMSVRIGEPSTIQLYLDYQNYLQKVHSKNRIKEADDSTKNLENGK